MLTLQYHEKQCNVTLLPGCLLRLEGKGGSGKTALLESIAGKRDCPPGTVLFAQKETRGDKEFFADLIYLSEYQEELTLRWTVQRQLNQWVKKGEKELLPAAIHYFSLQSLLAVKQKHLSASQRQRVRLARLVLQPSAIWLLDRPFLYLDEEGRTQLEALIAGRCQQNGMVMFTHDGATRLNPHGVVEL